MYNVFQYVAYFCEIPVVSHGKVAWRASSPMHAPYSVDMRANFTAILKIGEPWVFYVYSGVNNDREVQTCYKFSEYRQHWPIAK